MRYQSCDFITDPSFLERKHEDANVNNSLDIPAQVFIKYSYDVHVCRYKQEMFLYREGKKACLSHFLPSGCQPMVQPLAGIYGNKTGCTFYR